jgi:hypothetical protein
MITLPYVLVDCFINEISLRLSGYCVREAAKTFLLKTHLKLRHLNTAFVIKTSPNSLKLFQKSHFQLNFFCRGNDFHF